MAEDNIAEDGVDEDGAVVVHKHAAAADSDPFHGKDRMDTCPGYRTPQEARRVREERSSNRAEAEDDVTGPSQKPEPMERSVPASAQEKRE